MFKEHPHLAVPHTGCPEVPLSWLLALWVGLSPTSPGPVTLCPSQCPHSGFLWNLVSPAGEGPGPVVCLFAQPLCMAEVHCYVGWETPGSIHLSPHLQPAGQQIITSSKGVLATLMTHGSIWYIHF